MLVDDYLPTRHFNTIYAIIVQSSPRQTMAAKS